MQDLPDDPTGQLDKVEKFVEDNLDICKWVALGVLIVEVRNSSYMSLSFVFSGGAFLARRLC